MIPVARMVQIISYSLLAGHTEVIHGHPGQYCGEGQISGQCIPFKVPLLPLRVATPTSLPAFLPPWSSTVWEKYK